MRFSLAIAASLTLMLSSCQADFAALGLGRDHQATIQPEAARTISADLLQVYAAQFGRSAQTVALSTPDAKLQPAVSQSVKDAGLVIADTGARTVPTGSGQALSFSFTSEANLILGHLVFGGFTLSRAYRVTERGVEIASPVTLGTLS